jgi:hypothetical protein
VVDIARELAVFSGVGIGVGLAKDSSFGELGVDRCTASKT